MTELLFKFEKDIHVRGFSNSTIKSYMYKLKYYLQFCKEHSQPVNSDSFKDYIFSLKKYNKLSLASIKQNVGAVKFFLNTL
jgi:site-specific recombinase XerD